MLCRKQPRFLQHKGLPITHLLEIRVAPVHGNQIQLANRQRRRTYSTLTRYCSLRLARKCSLRWTSKLRQKHATVVQDIAEAQEFHRHLMCLYGDDVKLIRLAAMELGLTLSAFVRLAIELYLPVLAMEKHSRWFVSNEDLTWEGIRFIQEIQIFAVNGSARPFYRNLSCLPFEIDSYW